MQKFLNYALIFLIVLLIFQFFSSKPEQAQVTGDLTITMASDFTTGEAVVLTMTNNSSNTLQLPNDCPAVPFSVSRFVNGEWVVQSATTELACPVAGDEIELLAGQGYTVSYADWQRELFAETGRYRVEIPVTIDSKEKVFSSDFTVSQPGFFGLFWRKVFYQPLYNGLIYFANLTGGSFGWGVILLTLAIRLVLVVPFQRSLRAQRKMQLIQPELDQIKKQYANNQQMQASETMALFKKHKVNPLGSCLPILIQTPFLFAVFRIVQNGLGAQNYVLFYDSLVGTDLANLATNFYGLDLTGVAFRTPTALLVALPLVIGVLQFFQMRLAMARTAKQRATQSTKDASPMADAMKNMTKLMQYFLPVLIVFFAASTPAAVGLYWGASTLFGLGQQLVVNRQSD